MRKACLLYGGGLESTYLAILLKSQGIEFDLVWIYYGQRASNYELNGAIYFADKLNAPLVTLQTDIIRQMNQGQESLLLTGAGESFVAGRNLGLLLTAVSQYDDIYIGSHPSDPVPDSEDRFYRAIADVFDLSFKNTKKTIYRPLGEADTKEKMGRYCYNKIPEFFDKVASCWQPIMNKSCGECKHCIKISDLKKLILG